MRNLKGIIWLVRLERTHVEYHLRHTIIDAEAICGSGAHHSLPISWVGLGPFFCSSLTFPEPTPRRVPVRPWLYTIICLQNKEFIPSTVKRCKNYSSSNKSTDLSLSCTSSSFSDYMQSRIVKFQAEKSVTFVCYCKVKFEKDSWWLRWFGTAKRVPLRPTPNRFSEKCTWLEVLECVF